MNKSLDHLPPRKRFELAKVRELIEQQEGVEMIILFGSYARGGWVEHKYIEDNIVYEYQSDFDLLVITAGEYFDRHWTMEQKLDDIFWDMPELETPISLIFHTIQFVNKRIREARYFFVDILKEGIVLYDTQQFQLAQAGPLPPAQRKAQAEEDFEYWYTYAKEFIIDSKAGFDRKNYNKSAFELHQATECFYSAILLVYTGYKPKLHDLKKLEKQVNEQERRFIKVFPRHTQEQADCFKLLRRAYVDARYRPKHFHITKEQLEYLFERVEVLQTLAKEYCTEKIAELAAAIE